MAKSDVETWHLDKRVPIALILTLLLQMGTAIWWASRMDTRVSIVEDHIANSNAHNRAQHERFSAGINTNTRDIAVVTADVANTNIALTALKEEFVTTNQLLRQVATEHGRINGFIDDHIRRNHAE